MEVFREHEIQRMNMNSNVPKSMGSVTDTEKKVRKKQNYCGNANKVLCPCGKYTTFLDAAISWAISSAVSILLNSTRPSPASPINEIILK